jgi:anti-anti-sigma regulatory factor
MGISLELDEVADGLVLHCEGAVNKVTAIRLLKAIGRLLAIPIPYLCLDLRDLRFADRSLLHVLEAASAVAALERTRLEMIVGPIASEIIESGKGER